MKAIFRNLLITIIVIGAIIGSNLLLVKINQQIPKSTTQPKEDYAEVTLGVDYLPSSDSFLVCSYPFSDMLNLNFNTQANMVYELERNDTIDWEYRGLSFPHQAQQFFYKNTPSYLITDTGHDKVIMINDKQQLMWGLDLHMIKWIKIIPEWANNSYITNPKPIDWTHVNDVDFINGSLYNQTFNSLMISIRNFDMIMMINWTAELNEMVNGDIYGNTSNIYWHFGALGTNEDYIHHQHNPNMLPDGNIVIADSDYNRVIEINRTTGQIIWTLNQAGGVTFSWPRDIVYNPSNGAFLITDSKRNRIVEVDRNGDILWQWNQYLLIPYTAKYMPNGDILISGCGNGIILEVNASKGEGNRIVWSYNLNQQIHSSQTPTIITTIIQTDTISFTVLSGTAFFFSRYQFMFRKKPYISKRINAKKWTQIVFLSLFVCMAILVYIALFQSEILIHMFSGRAFSLLRPSP